MHPPHRGSVHGNLSKENNTSHAKAKKLIKTKAGISEQTTSVGEAILSSFPAILMVSAPEDTLAERLIAFKNQSTISKTKSLSVLEVNREHFYGDGRMFPCDVRYLHDKWNIKPRRVSPTEMLSRQTSRDETIFLHKNWIHFPCRVVYVKTKNEFVSVYSRGGSERGNSLAKPNARDYCSNINVKIPISAVKLVWGKPQKKL